MSPPSLLNIDERENDHKQRREWMIQRLFWALLYAAILAIILGAVGRGPLSHIRIGEVGDPLQFEYERFLRYRATEDLRITVHNGSPSTRLLFSKDYFRNIGIQRIMPEPEEVLTTEKAVVLVFTGTPSVTSNITVTISPNKSGRHQGWVAVDNHPPHFFNQFVYP